MSSPGTRAQSPELLACQGWQQVLSQIKKASFSVQLLRPDPQPHFRPWGAISQWI